LRSRVSTIELYTQFVGGKRFIHPRPSLLPLEALLHGADGTQAGSLCILDICRRSPRGKFAPKGLSDSAQGFNPGNRRSKRRALKGRQIGRTNNAAVESNRSTPQLRTLCTLFCATIGARFVFQPLAPSGRTVYFKGSQVENLNPVAPSGQGCHPESYHPGPG